LTAAKNKISLYCSVEERAVFTSYDVDSVYELPLVLEGQGMGDVLTEYLGLNKPTADWSEWRAMVERIKVPSDVVRIAMCGKYAELADCYVSVNEALRHSAAASGCQISIEWIETEEFENNPASVKVLNDFDGVIVPGGFGKRGALGKVRAIEFCRLNDKPFLGICYGLQLSLVEISRHVLGIEDADSTECEPSTSNPVIDLLPEQRSVSNMGGTMRLGSHPVMLKQDTIAHQLYGADLICERHRHRWEVNPDYWSRLEDAGVLFSGWSTDGRRKETIELPSNYFFFATQFHPEFKSRPWSPSPPYYGLVKASYDKKCGKPKPELKTPIKLTKCL
jgi:CTP synthase